MFENSESQFGAILEALSEVLDVPPSVYEKAIRSYEAVGEWLGAEGSRLRPCAPHVYPQGSFRYGTAIKRVTESDEVDIDLVCELSIPKSATTPTQLKRMVGDRLRESAVYLPMLEESNRCWTLHYADGTKFHMDILPAIPNGEGPPRSPGSILIPDTDLLAWLHSNPKGYAEWFKKRMEAIFQRVQAALAKSMRAEVEAVPEYHVRTPLQRAVQILKYHRNLFFERSPEDRPASIVLTTLAAHAYQNEADLYEALNAILRGMTRHIEERNGVLWVPNPVDPEENFADGWRTHPERYEKFLFWLRHAGNALEEVLAAQGKGLDEAAEPLRKAFGARTANAALEKFGLRAAEQRKAGHLVMVGGTGGLSTSRQPSSRTPPVREHTFYGDRASRKNR